VKTSVLGFIADDKWWWWWDDDARFFLVMELVRDDVAGPFL
jgi:hypothetical protein